MVPLGQCTYAGNDSILKTFLECYTKVTTKIYVEKQYFKSLNFSTENLYGSNLSLFYSFCADHCSQTAVYFRANKAK